MKRWMLFLIAAVFAAMPALALAQGAVELPQTGQKQCYDATGAVIDCSTTGQTQDGAVQAGVVWPEPRFTDNENGTVMDNLTGLIWLKDANCFGARTWAAALSDANGLADDTCGLSDGSVAGDWSLPNIVELESLVHAGFNEEDCSDSLCTTLDAWLKNQGFVNVQSHYHWSGTSYAADTAIALQVYSWDGHVYGYNNKSNSYFVWPVRGSLDSSIISLPRTGQTESYATGDDGDLERGVAWPDPRFQVTYCDGSGPCGDQSSDCDADPSNDVVYDGLTDSTWTRDANLTGDPRNWQGALEYMDTLNSGGLCGQADWRLPNRKELFSLVDFSQYNPALQAGHLFVNVHSDGNYWSGTSHAANTGNAWLFYMKNGTVVQAIKSSGLHVWPVQSGQVGPSVNSDISVLKTDDPDPVFTGAELTYMVTITNNGPDDATGVTLTDTLPGTVTFVSATFSQVTCTEAGGVVTCAIGEMTSGASETVTIIVTAPDAEGTMTNIATVDCTSNDPDTGNNSAAEETTVIYYSSNSDISVTKSDDPDPVFTGAELTYTVSITNNGPEDATGVTLTDTLPVAVTFVSATSSQGTCTEVGGVVMCDVGEMTSGTSATVTIIATTPDAEGTITNTATVDCTSNDPVTGNNSATEDTVVYIWIPTSDVSVLKTDDPDPVEAGQVLTYTVTITNDGQDQAEGVTLTDTLPIEVDFVSASTTQGSCTVAAGTVTCDIGVMSEGDEVVVTIEVDVSDTSEIITNTASVTTTSNDPDMSNNTYTVDTIVQLPEPSIEETIDFFDEAVEKDTITGSAGWIWGQIQLNRMRQLLTRARASIERGYIGAACWRLRSAYRGCDGEGYDWVVGDDADDLAQMIYDLAVSLDCWWTRN